MDFRMYSYLVTDIIICGAAILLYLTKRKFFPSGRPALNKLDAKIILWTMFLAVIASSPLEGFALKWGAWANSTTKTFNINLWGAAIETYIFSALIALVIAIATISYARREDRKHLGK